MRKFLGGLKTATTGNYTTKSGVKARHVTHLARWEEVDLDRRGTLQVITGSTGKGWVPTQEGNVLDHKGKLYRVTRVRRETDDDGNFVSITAVPLTKKASTSKQGVKDITPTASVFPNTKRTLFVIDEAPLKLRKGDAVQHEGKTYRVTSTSSQIIEGARNYSADLKLTTSGATSAAPPKMGTKSAPRSSKPVKNMTKTGTHGMSGRKPKSVRRSTSGAMLAIGHDGKRRK